MRLNRTQRRPLGLIRKIAAVPLISLLSCGNPAEPQVMQPIMVDPCRCECPPCEAPTEPSLSEKLDMISASVKEYSGDSFEDHMRFLDYSRFDDGEPMFPGIAKALRECPYYQTNAQRKEIASALIGMFRESPQEMSEVLLLMGRMPMTVTAHIASTKLELGDPFRMRLRRRIGGNMSESEKLHACASFLVQLGNALEKGDGVDAPLMISEEDWRLLDLDITARLIHWPVKRWWVDELQVWDVTNPDQLARYVCARMKTGFHKTISAFGRSCPSHLLEFTRGKRDYDFDDACRMLGVDCPTEPLSYLE